MPNVSADETVILEPLTGLPVTVLICKLYTPPKVTDRILGQEQIGFFVLFRVGLIFFSFKRAYDFCKSECIASIAYIVCE